MKDKASQWIIRGHDSLATNFERKLPGNISQNEICELLLRLTCSSLTLDEIVDCSRRKNDPKRKLHLDRIGKALPIHFGENPYFTAEFVKSPT